MKKNKEKYQNKWIDQVNNSGTRDYSFESASGEEVDLLYFPFSIKIIKSLKNLSQINLIHGFRE